MDSPNTSLAHGGPPDWIRKLFVPFETTQKIQLEQSSVAHFIWIGSQEEPITHLLCSLLST